MYSPAYRFIEQIKPGALKVQSDTGIPAAVMIAQACIETNFGQNTCTDIKTRKDGKNLFRLKGTGPAGSVECRTSEYYKGVRHRVIAKIRAYNTYEESFTDYSEILRKPRYENCMAVRDNPELFARKLQECGYSTDPDYARKIIAVMDKYNLDELVKTSPEPSPFSGDKISINLEEKKFKGLLISGVAYMPVRNIFEAIGYTVACNRLTKTVTLVRPER